MQENRRLDYIHGLRGVAALVVVLQHALQMVQEAGIGWFHPLLQSINLGRFGVALFFLISGLVIPFSFKGETPLRNFVISRVFRLYPAYWLSIPILAYVGTLRGWYPDVATVLANLTMIQGLFGVWDIGPGYWTLKYEMMFYTLCAVLFWRQVLGNSLFNGVFILVMLLLCVVPMLLPAYHGSLTEMAQAPFCFSLFFLGILLRRAMVDGDGMARKWAVAMVPLSMVVGALLGGTFFPVLANANPYFSPLALSAGMALPVLVFVLVLWWKPKPHRVLMYLGTVSYSLYLFQDIGLIMVPYVINPGKWPITYLLAVIGLALVVSSLVYRFLEEPMIEIGRKLTRRAWPASAAPAV